MHITTSSKSLLTNFAEGALETAAAFGSTLYHLHQQNRFDEFGEYSTMALDKLARSMAIEFENSDYDADDYIREVDEYGAKVIQRITEQPEWFRDVWVHDSSHERFVEFISGGADG